MKKTLKIFSILIVFILFITPTYANEKASVKLPVRCSNGADEKLSYVLEDKESGKVEQQIELSKGETGYFELSYDTPGNFYYTIKQISGKNSNVTYDKTIYDIKVFVAWDKNGNLYGEPIIFIDGKDSKYVECEFENKLIESQTPSTPDTPSKVSNTLSETPSNSPSNDRVQTGDSATYMCFFALAIITMFAGIKFVCKKD